MNQTEVVLYLMGNMFRIYVVYRFYHLFFRKCLVGKAVHFGVYFIYFFANSYMFLKFETPFINMLSNLAFGLGVAFLYQSQMRFKFLSTIMIYAITLFCEDIVYRMMIAFLGDNNAAIGIIAPNLLMLPIVLILEKVLDLKAGNVVSYLDLICIIFVPVFSIFILAVALYDHAVDALVAVIAGGLLLMNVIIFYLLAHILRISRNDHDMALQKKQIEMYKREFQILRKTEENVMSLRHDIKNHLVVIRGLAAARKNSQIILYVDSLDKIAQSPDQFINTGNITVDSILNQKFYEAKQLGSKLEFDIEIPDSLPFAAEDLGCILGNLLDNAICGLSECTEKSLNMKMHMERGSLYISICNTHSGNVVEREGCLLTTKKEKKFHGIGLKSVRQIVNKYMGVMEIQYDDQRFYVEALLCLKMGYKTF